MTYTVTGWRTQDEREAGERHTLEEISDAALLVAALLKSGCFQIIVEQVNR